MNEFEPRIESPPESDGRNRPGRDKYAKLRAFVIAANGQWCLVAQEKRGDPGQPNRLRGRLYGLCRSPGYVKTGIQLRAVIDKRTCKIYARYIAANALKNVQ
jgi:hypothetical protein